MVAKISLKEREMFEESKVIARKRVTADKKKTKKESEVVKLQILPEVLEYNKNRSESNGDKEVTKEIQEELCKLKTVSGRIRYLDEQGFVTANIARVLNKRYQHVSNVLRAPLKTK